MSFTEDWEVKNILKNRIDIKEGGGGGGTTNYERLSNKPQINSVELIGNKSFADIGIQAELDKKVDKADGTPAFKVGVDSTTGELYYEV